MPVEFEDFRFNDHGRALTVEEAARFFGTYGGILDYEFDDLVNGDDESQWTYDSGITHSHSDGTFTVQAASAWKRVMSEVKLPADHTIYVRTEGSDNYYGVIVGSDDDGNGYLVCNEGANAWKIYEVTAGAIGDAVHHVYHPYNSPSGDLIVTCRPFEMGDGEEHLWLQITLWRNDQHILTYSKKLAEPLAGPFHVGLAVYSSSSRTYSAVRVPELCLWAEYGTIDPGEEPMGGFERAMEGRYLKWFVRFNGALKVFRPKFREAAFTLAHPLRDDPRINQRQFKTRVRLMGAYNWGEAIARDLIATLGDRFEEVTNPMLMSEAECIMEAGRQIRRFASEAETNEAAIQGLPLLELEDRIDLPSGEWVVSAMDKTYPPGGIEYALGLRRYKGDV